MATSFAQQVTVVHEAQGFQEPQEPSYKRALDLFLVISAHLVLLPAFLLFWVMIPLAIWLDDPGPVFYKQRRVGKDGKVFTIIKFRTMVADAERRLGQDSHLPARLAEAHKLPDDPPVTRLGRWRRGCGLVQLPHL